MVRVASLSLLVAAAGVATTTTTAFVSPSAGATVAKKQNGVLKRPSLLVVGSSTTAGDHTHPYANDFYSSSSGSSSSSSSSSVDGVGGGATTATSLHSTVEATADYYYSPSSTSSDGFYTPLEEEPIVYDLSESIIQNNGWNLEAPSLNFARVLVLAASAVYGTNFAMVKLLDEQMPLAVSAALRFNLAAAVVAAVVLQGETTKDKDAVDERGAATWAGMEIGAWYCLGYLAQAFGLETADASKSAFFNALAVIVVPLLDSAFRGKQMGLKGISSIVLAILGVGLLQLGPAIQAGTDLQFTGGDVFCLGQALLFGIGYWRLEHKSSQFPHQAGRVTVGLMGGLAVGSTAFAAMSQELPTLPQLQQWLTDPFTLGALGWTALVSTALALYLETVALKAMSATELTILMTSVSLFGSGFAYFTMGETMSPVGMVGGLMIMAGCIFSSMGGASSSSSSAQAQLPALLTEEQDAAADWETNTLLAEETAPYTTSPLTEL